jgi:UDP-N-acetylglucosamine 2-epimerase (non-hydrolysing)
MTAEIKTFQNSDLTPEVGVIIGTRPGIVMFSPIIHLLHHRQIPHFIIHTGQHYSPNMDAQFFRDLNLSQPDYRLDGVSKKKTHGGQTALMLEGIEKVLMNRKPLLVLVGGDANTNLAGALAARKLHIQVGHLEAGERSFDWRMPEEHNRVIIDHISEHLFATGKNSIKNLQAEQVKGSIHMTGNPIVDASIKHLEIAKQKSDALSRFGLTPKQYGVLTTHREENVDVKENLIGELEGVSFASMDQGIPVLFLAHPRTLKRIKEFGLTEWVASLKGLDIQEAVGYLDFINLVANSSLIFTDSGGVQQEACIHHIPCVTLRDNTEWIETLDIGANRLAGCNPENIKLAAKEAMMTKKDWQVPFGDGAASEKICEITSRILKKNLKFDEQ